jgi:hypothetical protein
VPRVLPVLGFIGAALLIVSSVGTMFGFWGQASSFTAIATIPIALWEFSLGIYLVAKGFKSSPITSGM